MIGVVRRTPVHGVRLPLYASLALAIASVVACAPQDTPTGLVQASAPVVVPRGAVLDVGASGPGLDDGVPFFAYTSDLVPEQTRASYAADLAAAGFTGRDDGDGWTTYTRGAERLRVKVGETGPPTSIIVKVMSSGARATDTAGPGTTTAATLPSPTADMQGRSPKPLGMPDPPHGPSITAGTPGSGNGQGPGPDNGQGQGPGNGQGDGAGNGQGQGNDPPRPTATPQPLGSPTPVATPIPTAKPDPTRTPKPTKTPKPTRTPNPGGGGGSSPGDPGGSLGDPGKGAGGSGGGG